MLYKNIFFNILTVTCTNKFTPLCNRRTSRFLFSRNVRRSSTSHKNVFLEEQLKEIFKFKDTNVSNWIIEVSVVNFTNITRRFASS